VYTNKVLNNKNRVNGLSVAEGTVFSFSKREVYLIAQKRDNRQCSVTKMAVTVKPITMLFPSYLLIMNKLVTFTIPRNIPRQERSF